MLRAHCNGLALPWVAKKDDAIAPRADVKRLRGASAAVELWPTNEPVYDDVAWGRECAGGPNPRAPMRATRSEAALRRRTTRRPTTATWPLGGGTAPHRFLSKF